MICIFFIWLPCLEFTNWQQCTIEKISFLQDVDVQCSFIGKCIIWIHLELLNLTKYGGTILDLDVNFTGFNVKYVN